MASDSDPKTDGEGDRPLVRDYTFLALAALLVCGVILSSEVPSIWGLVPVLLGVAGVLLRWGAAAGLFLVTLATVLLMNQTRYPVEDRPPAGRVTDLALTTACLIYVAAQMRLQTLVRHGVPPDSRRQLRPASRRVLGRWFLPVDTSRRSGSRSGLGELMMLLIGAPLFGLVAYLLWLFRLKYAQPPSQTALPPALWQVVVILWAMAVGLAVIHAFLSYLGRATAGPLESALYLQDQLWTATRGEQRRLNRWLVWARLRRQRKEERQ